jgi:hypothetical protein
MAQRISDSLGISHKALDDAGVFDRYVRIDSLLHVDPHLLPSSTAPEMVAASKTLDEFWRDSVSIVKNIFEYGDRFWREAVRRFKFRENTNVGLGYAWDSTSGSAVGETTAKGLVETAQQIIRAGIEDPRIFELVGLLEPGVGPDLISDITVHIIEPHLLGFTERICQELGIACKELEIKGARYQLPVDASSGGHLILLPKDVLRDLPVAFDWSDLDIVCAYNADLRSRMNETIGDNWRRVTSDNEKQKIKRVLLENPEVLSDLLRQYRSKAGKPYDFVKDYLGETIWREAAEDIAARFPLDLKADGPVSPDNIVGIVLRICDHFRRLIEDNGLCRVFWTDEGEVRHERLAQLLFFGIADSYCRANDLDLSPEVNSGRGPVDFKISRGYAARVLVEVKWSKNSKLLHGFEVQVEQYAKAERTDAVILLVIQVTDSRHSIEKLEAAHGEALRAGKRAPQIKIVDGRVKKSASHY